VLLFDSFSERFLLPVLPLIMMYAGNGAHYAIHRWKANSVWPKRIFIIALLVNIPMEFFLSNIHQSGTVAVMDYIRVFLDTRIL
jgi:hypothetical protein